MKITIPKRDLSTILKHAVRAVERRNTIPILGNVLLSAKDNRLAVKATDLDIEVTTSVACEVARDGDTTVPALMIDSIVGKMKPDADIVLEQDTPDAQLQVKSGRSRFKLQTLLTADFPDLSVADMDTKFELPVADLSSILDRADFCISSEETRFYLNGIYLHPHKDGNKIKLRGVATDGHRLAQIECNAPKGAETFGSNSNIVGVIIPRKTVKLISTILKDGGIDKAGVQLSTTKVRFTLGNVILASKLIDGTFPDYARVVPQGNDKIMRLDRAELAGAVDRISTVSTERGRVAKFSLSTGKLTLTVVNPDTGSANEELDADYTGEPLEIGFNSHYMSEILSHVQGDQVELRLADPSAPVLITGADKPDALFVQMPMRA